MQFDIAFMTLCHNRPARLRRAVSQALWEMPDRAAVNSCVILVPDRPTPQVQDVVRSFTDPNCLVYPTPLPVMSPEHGQRWTQTRNWAMDQFDAAGHTARWLSNWDDDWVWGPGWGDPLAGLPALLNQEYVVSWEAVSLFVWARVEGELQVNLLQHHRSPLIGRYEKGWRRDERLTNQIQDETKMLVAADPLRQQLLPFYLMDCGTTTPEERRRLYNDYANAGKLDNYTRKYLREPVLMPLAKALAKKPAELYALQKATCSEHGLPY
jgi:hypothetical protein